MLSDTEIKRLASRLHELADRVAKGEIVGVVCGYVPIKREPLDDPENIVAGEVPALKNCMHNMARVLLKDI